MSEPPRRFVLSLTDAIVGGQGEGSSIEPSIASGFMTGSFNTAAAEWINTRLMAFDPQRIPLTREAFGRFRYPLVAYTPDALRVRLNDEKIGLTDVVPFGEALNQLPVGRAL